MPTTPDLLPADRSTRLLHPANPVEVAPPAECLVPATGAVATLGDAGDGPAVFIILIVGAIVTPLLIVLQFGLHLPGLVALGLTLAAAIALCLALLPPFKAILFALQWKHKASEATHRDVQ